MTLVAGSKTFHALCLHHQFHRGKQSKLDYYLCHLTIYLPQNLQLLITDIHCMGIDFINIRLLVLLYIAKGWLILACCRSNLNSVHLGIVILLQRLLQLACDLLEEADLLL